MPRRLHRKRRCVVEKYRQQVYAEGTTQLAAEVDGAVGRWDFQRRQTAQGYRHQWRICRRMDGATVHNDQRQPRIQLGLSRFPPTTPPREELNPQ